MENFTFENFERIMNEIRSRDYINSINRNIRDTGIIVRSLEFGEYGIFINLNRTSQQPIITTHLGDEYYFKEMEKDLTYKRDFNYCMTELKDSYCELIGFYEGRCECNICNNGYRIIISSDCCPNCRLCQNCYNKCFVNTERKNNKCPFCRKEHFNPSVS